MAVSYKKLWHILIDRNMKKKDLESLAGINHYTMTKMRRDKNVSLEVLDRICEYFQCDIGGIIERREGRVSGK